MVSAERTALARATGEVAVQALAAGLRPRDIMTRTAFLNAAAVVMATFVWDAANRPEMLPRKPLTKQDLEGSPAPK